MIDIRSRYRVMGEVVKGLTFKKPSRTCQQFKDEADINNLIARYANTGCFYDPIVQAKAVGKPQFGDFTVVPADYQQAQNMLVEAREAFDALPSKVRARFSNDPMQLFEFLSNEENKDEAIRLGLINKPVEPVKSVEPENVPPAAAAQ